MRTGAGRSGGGVRDRSSPCFFAARHGDDRRVAGARNSSEAWRTRCRAPIAPRRLDGDGRSDRLPAPALRGEGANAFRPRRLEVWQTPGKLHAALLRGRARSRSAGGAKDRRGDCDRAAAAAQGTRDRRECRRGEPRQPLSSLSRHLRPVSGLQIDPGRLSGMDEADAAVLPRLIRVRRDRCRLARARRHAEIARHRRDHGDRRGSSADPVPAGADPGRAMEPFPDVVRRGRAQSAA